MELQITWGYTKQKRFIRFKKWQKVDCLYFVCWRRLCDWSRELDCKYHSLEPTQKLFQGHLKGLRRMLQILMRKIKLQKGLMIGARSKIESSQVAILSQKKHILDFQDFFSLFQRSRYRVWEFCMSSQTSSMISKALYVFCHKPHIPVLF